MDLTGNIFIRGPAGKLEALLKEPAGEIKRAVVVCHPHPLFGGTMHNKVVYRIAKTFFDSGFAALRFNFRGAGRSEGTHDAGRGEQDDLRSAVRFVEEKYRGAELWLAGFSFGAAVLLRAGCAGSVRALVAVGTPVSKYDFASEAICPQPALFVQGERDEFGTVGDLEKFTASLSAQVKVIEGADHFFEGHLGELSRAVSEFIASIIIESD
ncbi:MAG: alpha/beta fold hydrolase [Acidobacteriota bacterium]